MKTPTLATFIVVLLATLATFALNACTPRRDVLRDDGGEYTVSASSQLTAGIETQLRAPRIVLEIRNYDSNTWGQRSRAALKITWYDESPITGTADVALVERDSLDTLVLTSQQPIDIALPAGRRSRTVTYYSSYFYSPDAAMCAEAALTLNASDGSNFIRIGQDQRACEDSDQATPQFEMVTNQSFDLGNGDIADMELFKNDAGEYRGKLRFTATQGGWTPTKDGNRMGIRLQDRSRYKRSNGFTAGFAHPGQVEFVTRWAPDLTAPVCFDVTIVVRDGMETLLTLCDGEPQLMVEQIFITSYTINGVDITYSVERGTRDEGVRLTTMFDVPAGETVWQDQFDYGNAVILEGLPGDYPANQVQASLEQDIIGPAQAVTVTPFMADVDYTDFCFYLEGVMSEGQLDLADYVYDERCTFEPDPDLTPEPPTLSDDYTLIWNIPYVLQNGQGAFDFEIHQHNTEANTFRAQLTTAFHFVEIDSPTFTITGYADAPTSASVPFTPNTIITTDWIQSFEPGEEVCFLLEGTYNAYDAETLNRVSDTFRYSACMENRIVTNPPTPSSLAGAVASIPDTQGVVTVWLMADGDAIDTSVLISPMPESRDQTGIRDEGYVRGVFYDSGITLGASYLDIPDNNGGMFELLDDEQPCLELDLVYGMWDAWENYFVPQLFEMSVCLPD